MVRLDVDGLERDRLVELFDRRVVAPERAECAGKTCAQRAVVGGLLDERRVLARRILEPALLEMNAGEVAVARRRFRADVAEARQLLDDLRIGFGIAGSGGAAVVDDAVS